MNAGLPGIGISGVFYVICILLMLCIEIYHVLKGSDRAWHRKVAFKQFAFLCCIIGGYWAMIEGLGKVINIIVQKRNLGVIHLFSGFGERSLHFFKLNSLLFSAVILACVLGSLVLMNWILGCRGEKC
jgi:hypothetical protein